MMYISGLKVALQIELLRARPTTLVEALSLARMTEARFEDERTTTTIVNPNDLNIAIPDQVETKVLVDGKQDDAKVVKVVGVAIEQNNDEPNVLKGIGVIGVGVNEIKKLVDKELHVLIPLLKGLNDKHIKKKKMKAEIQRRI
ncbi:hypothetical protein Tco_1264185 [Tanacetum coccineum]